jgi:hypothetical protein
MSSYPEIQGEHVVCPGKGKMMLLEIVSQILKKRRR